MAAAGTALLNAPKSIRDDAQALARRSAAKIRLNMQSAAKVEVPAVSLTAGVGLGLVERFAGLDPAYLGGIDNGVVLGLPAVVAGALTKGTLSRWLLIAGAGLLTAGGRTMAREFGAEDSTTEGIG